MSELSPGSKATTNLFILLGIIVLAALAWSVGNRAPVPLTLCTERLVSKGDLALQAESADGSQVTVSFNVMDDGSIQNLSIPAGAAITTSNAAEKLAELEYLAKPGAAPLECRYNLSINPN